MLDHAKLLQQLQNLSSALFASHHYDYDLIRALWDRILADPLRVTKVAHASAAHQLPHWPEATSFIHDAQPHIPVSYTALAVDGSQVYPDRHQGTVCYLLNIGSSVISYGAHQQVHFQSQPYVFTGNDSDHLRLTPDLVDCRRQEYEMVGGIDRYSFYNATKKLLLYDGSLIFWHLSNQSPELKRHFMEIYTALLEQLYTANALVAWYISAPKNKDLVNLMRYLIEDEKMSAQAHLESIHDTMLVATFLQPYQRTVPCASGSTICSEYPTHVAPYFFYMHVGSEIARVELPAWLAQDASCVDAIAGMILDQALKGRGYPVVLAESHEQAVVKGPDRDFFYHMLAKISIDSQHHTLPVSPKTIKKRGIGI